MVGSWFWLRLTVHFSRPGRREKLHEHRIADPLHLLHKMVRNYVSSIFTKLGVARSRHAVARTREAGLRV